MTIDRDAFFSAIKRSLQLHATARAPVDAILDAWEASGLTDLRWLAYMLATVRRECGPKMAPVREGFKATDAEARAFVRRQKYKYAVVVAGHVYYGRGLVQLTWRDNYVKMGKLLGIDLAGDPDLALDPDIASRIMFEGMQRGTFTGKKLSQFFNRTTDDPVNARTIINRLDHASEIAGFHRKALSALHASIETAEAEPAAAAIPALIEEPDDADRPEGALLAIKERLNKMGYPPGRIDDEWGGMTAEAIVGFMNDVPEKPPFAPPASDVEFWKVRTELDELTKRHVPTFRRPIAEARANATATDLSSAGNKTTKSNLWTRAVAKFQAIGAAISLAFWAAIEKLSDSETLKPVIEALGSIPRWAYVVTALSLVGIGAGLIWRSTNKSDDGVVESFQTGKLRSAE